jgi:hypothetical protein
MDYEDKNLLRNRKKTENRIENKVSSQNINDETFLEEFKISFKNNKIAEIDKNSYFLTRIILVRFLAFIYGMVLIIMMYNY